METFIAAVFASQSDAEAFQTALLSDRRIDVKRTGVYGRNVDGELALQGDETDKEDLLDLLAVSQASQQEAVDELNEQLPTGSYALLALVSESVPSVVDDLAREYGGTVYRRAPARLETDGFHRFTDASGLE